MLSVRKVQVLLAERCLTIKELATASGLNEVAISRILNRKTKATYATIGKLAKGLNVPAAELMTDD